MRTDLGQHPHGLANRWRGATPPKMLAGDLIDPQQLAGCAPSP